MSRENTIEVPLNYLKDKLGKKKKSYAKLSQKFYLPAFNSKAVTVEYLKSYVLFPCPIFRITRDEFKPPFIIIKHINSIDLLENIEEILKSKNLPPTGTDQDKLPDFNWLVGVYFFLCLNDERKLFPKTIRPETKISIKIDPE